MALIHYTATCTTAECGNAGQPIPMVYDDDDGKPGGVLCGVCSQPITELEGLAL